MRTLWAPCVDPYVGAWIEADDTVWHPQRAHTDASYAAYLMWYLLRTRSYCTLAAQSRRHLPPTL
jgi:hypothetical protein